jgi:ketosteroid isomerase-like protein
MSDERNTRLAEAFSRHRFDEVYEFLADDVKWNNVGGDQYAGRQAVIDACRGSAAYLSGVTTTFARVRVVGDAERAVVDVVATYSGEGAQSVVSSCDIYEFAGDRITEITSYTVEL